MTGPEYMRRCRALGDRGLDLSLVQLLQEVGDEELLADWEAMTAAEITATNVVARARRVARRGARVPVHIWKDPTIEGDR